MIQNTSINYLQRWQFPFLVFNLEAAIFTGKSKNSIENIISPSIALEKSIHTALGEVFSLGYHMDLYLTQFVEHFSK